ncbi:reticulon-like protein B1 [Tanacetum coccineum]
MANTRRHGYSVSSLMDTAYWLSESLIFKISSFKLQNARLLLIFIKSPPTIPEVKISEDTHRHVAGAVKIEVNNFLSMLRNVASRRDLKKFLAASDI